MTQAPSSADHRLVALDAKTGEVQWKTLYNRLPAPVVTVQHGVAWAAAADGVGGKRHGFDARNGGPPPPVDETAPGALAGPVVWLEPVRLDDNGETLLEGTAQAQRVRVAGVLRGLEAPVADVQRAGNRVVLTWAPGAGMGSHVVGLDASEGLLAWELDLTRHIPSFHDGWPVAIHAAADAVTVMTGAHVLVVHPANGSVASSTALPAQQPIVEGGRGCRVARAASGTYLGCRHGLARLDGAGALLFWADTGKDSWPTPTPFEGVVLTGARDERAAPSGPPVKGRDKPPLFVLLVRDQSWLGGYRPEFVRGGENAAKERVLWSLAHPPSPDSAYVVHLHAGKGADARVIMVDVGDALKKQGRAVVRAPSNTHKMVLMEGPRQILSTTR
jgi:outer membrane protein assembly factor BamB